jgi:hypothetical protein
MRYEINKETFAIHLYDDINPDPFQYQPDYPNTDKFDSYAEAEDWAKLAIKSRDPLYLFFAPNGKGIAGEAKPTERQIMENKLAAIGLTVEELKLLLG